MSVLSRIDPELLTAVRQMPVIVLVDIPAARARLRAFTALATTANHNAAVARSEHVAPGIDPQIEVKLRMFRPVNTECELPCVFWIQGGGYVLTAMDLDDAWCEDIARRQHCSVLSVLWRRAPEHPFPAASDDCYAALRWAFEHAAELGLDASRILVAGASSGAGIAAGLALRARDNGAFALAHQLLIYPMLDDRARAPSSHWVTDLPLWNHAKNEIAWRAYLGKDYGTDRVSAYAAPSRAKSLFGVCSATMLTGELDLFLDEDMDYAQRLMHAGVPTELHVYPAAHHGFDRHAPSAAVSRRLLADRDAAIDRVFRGINYGRDSSA